MLVVHFVLFVILSMQDIVNRGQYIDFIQLLLREETISSLAYKNYRISEEM